jgi:hypothetical protein
MKNLNDLREQALAIMNRDIGRMVDNPNPVYRGNTSVPMSVLTQRKRQLEDQFSNAPAPYSVEATSSFNRTPQGFNEGQKTSLLDILSSGQRGVGNTGWRMMGKQFGDRTGSRQTGFYNKFDKNLNKGLDLSRVGIDALSNDAKSYESEYNQGLGNSLNALGNAEKAKREGLTNMLGQFGNQQHIYSHLANAADKSKYYEELNAPKQKMKALYNIVNSGGNPDNMGPYGEAAAVKTLKKGVKLYNSPTPSYSGQQLASVPEELSDSHRLLEELSPNYNDSSRTERDNLVDSLMTKYSPGTRAIANLPQDYDPQVDKLDGDTKQLLKAEKARISMDHERKGTYGSQSHLSQTEDAINRIAKSRFGNRNNLLQDVLRGRMSSLNKSDMNDLNQLNSLGQQGLSEYQDVLGRISGMNQRGVDKWLNAQDELNQRRERFEEERNQEWPQGSGSDIVKYNVSPEISSIFANPNISSNPSVYTPSLRPNIHALAQHAQTVPISHSEIEFESSLNPDITNIRDRERAAELVRKRHEEARLAEANRVRQQETERVDREQQRLAEANRVRQEEMARAERERGANQARILAEQARIREQKQAEIRYQQEQQRLAEAARIEAANRYKEQENQRLEEQKRIAAQALLRQQEAARLAQEQEAKKLEQRKIAEEKRFREQEEKKRLEALKRTEEIKVKQENKEFPVLKKVLENNLPNNRDQGIVNSNTFKNKEEELKRTVDSRRQEEERLRLLRIAEENRIKQLQEQEKIKQAELLRITEENRIRQLQEQERIKQEQIRQKEAQQNQALLNIYYRYMNDPNSTHPKNRYLPEYKKHIWEVARNELLGTPYPGGWSVLFNKPWYRDDSYDWHGNKLPFSLP